MGFEYSWTTVLFQNAKTRYIRGAPAGAYQASAVSRCDAAVSRILRTPQGASSMIRGV